ncbi:winged helix-turn-helix transcriptional regulator [Sphingomonas sp. R86521]|uniref:winged helix-turn-helix transcriptional regulator n=1 Tax=Sphingomonas sp. R86521 TaxID=3093860 RepID=UPI0036D24D4E
MTDTMSPPPAFSCGLDATLRIISGKWKPLIVYFLAQGPNRYGELRRAVRGVSDKMLIQHLKELEADGIVLRTDHHEVPPRVDYTLTSLGHSLAQALAPLCVWGADNMDAVARVFAERESWSRPPA